MFFNRGDFIIEMFSYAVVDEACRATKQCISDRSCYTYIKLVHCISSSTQSGVRDRAFVSSACALRGGVG